MKKIALTQGKFALVDDEDYEKVSKREWVYRGGYASKTRRLPVINKVITLGMHRLVMNLPIGEKDEIDHIDGNRLNNQKYNLRVCTRSQNMMNKSNIASNKSGYKGVCWNEVRRRWIVQIGENNKQRYIGHFFCLIKAAKAYDKAAKKYHGEFARLNFPQQKL